MTKEQIETQLKELKDAKSAILRAQEYTTTDGRRLKRPDLNLVSDEIRELERALVRKSGGGGLMMRRIVPTGV